MIIRRETGGPRSVRSHFNPATPPPHPPHPRDVPYGLIANLVLSYLQTSAWARRTQALSFIDYVSQMKGRAFISTRMRLSLCAHMEAFAGQMGYFLFIFPSFFFLPLLVKVPVVKEESKPSGTGGG